MNTDLPAAVSPFDAAFDGPESASQQDSDSIVARHIGGKFVIHDQDNESAWITCEEPLEIQ